MSPSRDTHMQILHFLALSSVFFIQITEPATLLKGGEKGNHNPIVVTRGPSDLSLASTSTSASTRTTFFDSDLDSTPKDNTWLASFKNLKGRRRFSFVQKPAAWIQMNFLAGSPGYIIRLYRAREENTGRYLAFELSPDKLRFVDKKMNRVLIQTVTSENRTLCIFTQDPFQNYTRELEFFVRQMIAAKNSEGDKLKVFKMYKKQMGLPIFGFDYKIYAWETDSDCAFYNLGIPKNVVLSTAETEVATDAIPYLKTYTTQVSHTFARTRTGALPVTVMFMNRYNETETSASCRVKPITLEYSSLAELYIAIKDEYKIVTQLPFNDGEKPICAALFRKSKPPTELEESEEHENKNANANVFSLPRLAKHAYEVRKQGIFHIRIARFGHNSMYASAFNAFCTGENENEITVAVWEQVDQDCQFPVEDELRRDSEPEIILETEDTSVNSF